MRKFIVITLAIVIVLLLLKNVEQFAGIIKTVTDVFDKSFKAATNVDQFK
jgi:hypothetical protein